jgi:hypothetical protein
MLWSWRCLSGVQKGIEFARGIEGIEIVTAADMGFIDKNLRYRRTAICTLGHGSLRFAAARDINMLIGDAFLLQKVDCRVAIGAPGFCVDGYLSHWNSVLER